MSKKIRALRVLFFVLAHNGIIAMEQDPKTLVFDLIVPFLSYRDQMSCMVLLNQNWHACAMNMCTRKKILLPSFPDQSEPLARLVHRHGDECFYAYRDWALFGAGALALHSCKLSDDDKPHNKHIFFESFISPLPHNPVPFIENGQWHFYGCGELQFHHYPEQGKITAIHEVIRYCLDGSLLRCAIRFGENQKKYSMMPFITRPGLLSAILNSTIQNIRADQFPPCLEFSLEGATVPPNFPDADSFDDLSAEVKDMLMQWGSGKIP